MENLSRPKLPTIYPFAPYYITIAQLHKLLTYNTTAHNNPVSKELFHSLLEVLEKTYAPR